MTTFVLVPGFWLGAKAWDGVTRPLRAAGHDVYPLSPTGLGERAHLARPDVDLATHIADIVQLIEYEDLHDVVLVGHSGGGLPVAGAADRVPERLAHVVYLESAELPDGMAQIDTGGPEGRAFVEQRMAEAGDGWRYPLPSWEELEAQGPGSLEGLGEQERALFQSQAGEQPAGTMTQPLRLTNPAREQVPHTLVSCMYSLAQLRELIEGEHHPLFAGLAEPRWRLAELPTGHWPMFSRPADTARLLAGIAG